MTDLVIFDLDGTLVDTPTGIVRAFAAALAHLDLTAAEPNAIRATVGRPLDESFGSLLTLPIDHPTVLRAVAQYQVSFREIVLPAALSLVFPGVAKGLDQLLQQGDTLAVATSKFTANAEALLIAAELRDRFTLVVGADQVSRPKPDPEMGRLVLQRLGIRAEDAVMVGDTTHDILMARAAGIRSIAVTYGVHDAALLTSAGPTWIANNFEGVLHCLEPAVGAGRTSRP